MHISPNDIDICHRMYGRNNNGPKAIIVRFQITQTEEVIKIIRLNQYFLARNAVHINKNLTNYKRKLFAKVRKFKKRTINSTSSPGLLGNDALTCSGLHF